jgi:16S rRNA (guanine966-N2)-methyltransferase
MLGEELKRLVQGTPTGPAGQVRQMSAERFLSAPGEPFDVVFLDPPFAPDALTEPVRLIDAGGWVAAGAWIYLESARAAGLPSIPRHWTLLKSKFAGEVGYHLARVNA